MSLIFKTPEPVAAPKSGGFSWDAWYEANKSRLSEKRARRYQEDPNYREAALQRSRQQREAKKQKKAVATDYTVTFNEAADIVGVTVWVLREWRRKDYFPEPYHQNGRLWFKPSQVALLHQLREFFQQYGVRVGARHSQGLEELTNLTYANW